MSNTLFIYFSTINAYISQNFQKMGILSIKWLFETPKLGEKVVGHPLYTPKQRNIFNNKIKKSREKFDYC